MSASLIRNLVSSSVLELSPITTQNLGRTNLTPSIAHLNLALIPALARFISAPFEFIVALIKSESLESTFEKRTLLGLKVILPFSSIVRLGTRSQISFPCAIKASAAATRTKTSRPSAFNALQTLLVWN